MRFRWDWFGGCRCAYRVGDDPGGAGQGDANGIAGPIEVIITAAREIRNPDQQLEYHDLGGEEACGQWRHDASKDGDSGPEKAHSGCIGPEHLGRWQPPWDPTQQAGHVNNVNDAEGNGANTEEEYEEGPAA